VEVYWHAVTYKTVAVYGLLILVIITAGTLVAKPDWTEALTRKVKRRDRQRRE
jgi:hypothetical protein